MKKLLLIYDFNILTGEVYTNKGIFTMKQWDILYARIEEILDCVHDHGFQSARRIKRGFVLNDVNLEYYKENF